MKKIVTILSVALLFAGWYQTVDVVFGASGKYEGHIKAAEAYAKKEIYEDALEEYQQALAIEPDSAEAKIEAARMNLYLNEKQAFLSLCMELIQKSEVNETAMQMLADYYDENGEQAELVQLLKELREEHAGEKIIKKMWKKYRGSYETLFNSYEEIRPFCNGCAVAVNEGAYGLIDTQSEPIFGLFYDEVTDCSSELKYAAVSEKNKWYYMNFKNHKKIVPDEVFDYLGCLSEGTAVVKKKGKYGYANTDMKLLTKCEFDSASNRYGDCMAVEKNGKWAILNGEFKEVTKYAYSDVILDESGFCSKQNRIFVKKKDGYHMVDTDGTEVGSLIFEDARAFGEDSVTAVCMKGKWGFVNTDGELVLDCKFEDAKAFAYGLAPVKSGGAWGYIDSLGEYMIEPKYEDAHPFNQSGTAPVKEENWLMILLYALQ